MAIIFQIIAQSFAFWELFLGENEMTVLMVFGKALQCLANQFKG